MDKQCRPISDAAECDSAASDQGLHYLLKLQEVKG